jgi:cobalt-zinc-cadmium resistance protein CzcA
VPGVVEINTFGGELRTYQVEVTPERLASYGVSLDDLFEALERNNGNVGGGYLVKGREQTLVRGVALYETLEDIAAVVVDTTPRAHPSPSACSGRRVRADDPAGARSPVTAAARWSPVSA